MGKKRFIDKKRAISFRLAPRSQKDPLIVTDASAYVLAPLSDDLKSVSLKDPELPSEKRLAEQHKYGIYFDDDYNYLQHLKDVNEVEVSEFVEERYRLFLNGTAVDAGKDIATEQNLKLPSSLFENSGMRLKIGLLNQAAPQPGPHPELDSDIVALLDDEVSDTEVRNDLEDDFVLKANAPCLSDGDDEHSNGEDEASEKNEHQCQMRNRAESEVEAGSEKSFMSDEVKSRFTNYSLTSSTIRRSEGLKKIDEMFEKIYEQYDEEEMGDLETSTKIEGFIRPNSERMLSLVEDYQEKRKSETLRRWKAESQREHLALDRVAWKTAVRDVALAS
ncbi:unnamed protein product [Soboliphyme baturini]|uniref:Protein LTV1 homolog n=1 Tax=Soboliphyme baturini TaxID=241478 RepID=A0A183IF75_9BILA|nr:unnamed protein product [Soboliphyme baturini]